jgi:hypothetical protein
MSLKKFIYPISLFLLIAFLSVKVISVHQLIHAFNSNTPIEKCELCDVFLAQQLTPFMANNAIDVNTNDIILLKKTSDFYRFLFFAKSRTSDFFNKPPPFQA